MGALSVSSLSKDKNTQHQTKYDQHTVRDRVRLDKKHLEHNSWQDGHTRSKRAPTQVHWLHRAITLQFCHTQRQQGKNEHSSPRRFLLPSHPSISLQTYLSNMQCGLPPVGRPHKFRHSL